MTQKLVQLVTGMLQRQRPTSHAAIKRGMAAMIALTEKWVPGWWGPHQPLALLTPTTAAFHQVKAAIDTVNIRMPRRP